MPDFVPANFWWKNITGPSAMIADTVSALSEGYSVMLGLPDFTPWPDTMRNVLHENISSAGDVYISLIDASSECGDDAESYILAHYDKERRYRSRLYTVQEYFLRTGALRDHIFWLHNFRDKKQFSDWVQFCSKYYSTSMNDGLFILESQDITPSSTGNIRAINFVNYASRYDLQIFSSFLLGMSQYTRQGYNQNWDQYISSVVSMMFGTDAELAEYMIRTTNFMREEPIDAVARLSEEFPDRSHDESHLLNMYENNDMTRIKGRLWTAQVQVFFPMIELARVRLLRSYDGLAESINRVLKYLNARGTPMIQSDGKAILEASDIDLGGLFHVVCASGMTKINDVTLNEYISILRSFRNSLAHMNPCSVERVCELLDFEEYYHYLL